MSIADAKAALARAYASGETPRLDSVSPSGRNELWKLGDAVFLLPVVPSDAPPELEYALRLRREASLSGRCEGCGAAFNATPLPDEEAGDVSVGLFPHRGNCLAADENVAPLLDSYLEAQSKLTTEEALAAASRSTQAKLVTNLPERTNIPATAKMKQLFTRFLDEKIATAKGRCGHLESNPAQTWHIFMWDDTWRCDECLLRFSSTRLRDGPILSPLEESTCDYCRRYSPTYLQQTVSRIDLWVLYGAACRRCEREFTSGGQDGEGKP